MRRDLEEIVGLVACPQCGATALRSSSDSLHCDTCDARYPLRDGVPVFVDNPETVRVVDEGHQSNPMSDELVAWLSALEGYSLNIGAGASRNKIEKSIEMEYAIFSSTDVIGDAHRLPFKDNTFEAVVAMNVFEHLHSPHIAANEILRVLQPGGKLLIHTAFLQPLHEEPFHFYNATEHGVRQWFSRFDIDVVQVSDNFTPALTLAWLVSELIYYSESFSSSENASKLLATTLKDWQQIWHDPNRRQGELWDIVCGLPPEIRARFSAGFELKATKPAALSATMTDTEAELSQEELIAKLKRDLAAQIQETKTYRQQCGQLMEQANQSQSMLQSLKHGVKRLLR